MRTFTQSEEDLLHIRSILIFVIVGLACAPLWAGYDAGDGSADHPFQIAEPNQLVYMSQHPEDWNKNFLLTADINMNLAEPNTFTTALIAPDGSDEFTGIFDGDNHIISNLTIDTYGVDNDYLGLFGRMISPVEINNLHLENVNISGGVNSSCLGSLCGYNTGGTISNCSASGFVTGGENSHYLGGLCGINGQGCISNSHATNSITGESYIGGLVGFHAGDYYSATNIIENCHAHGPVNGYSGIGGLVGGQVYGMIIDSYASGSVTGGENSSYIGGLGGSNLSSTITNCYATGSVEGNSEIGGLIGYYSGTMSNSYATGSVNSNDYSESIGGLIGIYFEAETDSSNILNSYSTGSVSAGDYSDEVGGLVGRLGNNNCYISNSYSTSPVSCGIHSSCIGGLVGHSSGTIYNSYATGCISGGFDNIVLGGLVGYQQEGTIADCHAGGNISGNENSRVGGLVGEQNEGTVTNCYAIGSVVGSHGLGGLFGRMSGIVTYCYSTGSINGDDIVGGLVGLQDAGTIKHCYATGSVSGISNFGGFVGRDYNQDGSYIACFWDQTVNPNLDGIANWPDHTQVLGETTENLQTASTFIAEGWDFVGESDNGTEDIWDILENESYPYLQSNPPLRAICIYPKPGESVLNQTSGVNLSWQAGVTADSHNVYFGTMNPPSYQTNQTETTWFTGSLNLATTYYWRIDEVEPNGVVIPGGIWHFSINELGAGGAGTAGDPVIIETAEQLNAIGLYPEHWGKHFLLTNNLDLSAYDGQQGRPSFNIIGLCDPELYTELPFTGTFDGNGHTISNFNYVDPNRDYLGLFGFIGKDSRISDLGLINVNVEGDYSVGGVVGYSKSGNIISCYCTGSVIGNNCIGGLAGSSDWYSKSSVFGNDYVGGLTGTNGGIIDSCFSTGLVSGNSYVGGLVGRNYSGIIASFWDTESSGQTASGGGHGLTTAQMKDDYFYSIFGWSGNVWTLPENDYPHLAWENAGGDYISDPNVTMAGSGTANDPWQVASVDDFLVISSGNYFWDKHYVLTSNIDLDGIAVNTIGYDRYNCFTGTFDGNEHTISNFSCENPSQSSYVGLFSVLGVGSYIANLGLTNVSVAGAEHTGSLAGWNEEGTVFSCYSTGEVNGQQMRTGGLIGSNYKGTIHSCYSNILVNGDRYVGGLVGDNYHGNISSSYSYGAVSGISTIGGLVGNNSSTIMLCYNSGTVNGSDRFIGGLCGYNSDGDINYCYNSGLVNGNDYVGGLVGQYHGGTTTASYNSGLVTADCSVGGLIGNYSDGTVTACYSAGSVNGRCVLGGLVGRQVEDAAINNCYATGIVNGVSSYNYNLGGLVGESSGTIINCYATGSVLGDSYLGGLVGRKTGGSIIGGFFLHPDDGGGPDNGYGTPLTDPNMRIQSSFVGWDFADVWDICEGTNYPRLLWQILAGDFVCPYGVGPEDLIHLAQHWLLTNCRPSTANADINGDDIVDLSDFSLLAASWLMTDCGQCSGADLDGNEQVDLFDNLILMNLWLDRYEGDCGMCDLNDDGIVNILDYSILSDNWLK